MLEFTDPVRKQRFCIPAQVPGNVLGDLHRAGLVGDPCFGHNSEDLRPYEYTGWCYRRRFVLPEPSVPGEVFEVEFGGIDTVAEVYFNGRLLGKADNMFVAQRFVLPADAVEYGGENELRVEIAAALSVARDYDYPPQVSALAYNYESLYLRKARYSYGWDIAPRLVGAGLWRPVEIRSVPARRWKYSYLHTKAIAPGVAHLILHWEFELPPEENFEDLWARLTMRCGNQSFATNFIPRFCAGARDFDLPDPQLWWPMDSGEQPLYECELVLKRNDELLAVRKFTCGVRTVKLERTETVDAAGNGKFGFIVNGQPVFIHGANHVPATALQGEEAGRAVRNLAMWSELHCNMIRIWGGGVYEDDEFYDECDRRGILVWQDFMLGCECAPLTGEFLGRMKREAVAVVRRLRQHPSLALWAGDNECDTALAWKGGGTKRMLPSYNRITREVFPQALAQEDPYRDYLPSSPYVADEVWPHCSGDALSPEQHLWGPRNYWKSDFYRNNRAIFASELGYHGMPSIESMREFLPAESVGMLHGNRDWLTHVAQPFGLPDGEYAYRIELMYNLVRNGFGDQQNLADFVDASQFVQAEGLKFMIELFRMGKPRRTGLIWWNVIDCWPQFSDAIVDYYGRRKAAWDYVKCSQQPVLLMCGEPCECCDGTAGIAIKAVNDLMRPVEGDYTVSTIGGSTLRKGRFSLSPNSPAVDLDSVRVDNLHKAQMLLLEWTLDGKRHANFYLCGTAPYDLAQYREWHEILKKRVFSLDAK